MPKQLLFFINAHAGKSSIREDIIDVLDIFTKNGWLVTTYITQKPGEIQELLPQYAPHFDLVVASGGDGTLNETLSGMMLCKEKLPIGYLPTGTTNDFANSIGLPKATIEAAQVAVQGKAFPCDVGIFNNRYFAYVAAFGIFTEVSYSTPQPAKNILGRAAYILEGIKSLTEVKTYKMQVEYEGGQISGEFLFGMVSNSTSVGGFSLSNWLDVSMNDGLLEVILIRKPQSPQEFQSTIAALIRNDLAHGCIYHFQTKAVRLSCLDALPWTLDGEFGGNLNEVQISLAEQALTIMIPQT